MHGPTYIKFKIFVLLLEFKHNGKSSFKKYMCVQIYIYVFIC